MNKSECDNKEESMWSNNRKPYVMQEYPFRIGMIERRQHLAMTPVKQHYFLVQQLPLHVRSLWVK